MKLKRLEDVLAGVHHKLHNGDLEKTVTNIEIDSRKVEKGGLFIAIRGTAMDGHDFIGSAIENGAETIVCSYLPGSLEEYVTYVEVQNSAQMLGLIASNFWGDPSKKLKLVGVTGTNGKTTIVTLLYNLLQEMGFKTGLLSTIENRIAGEVIPTSHTTPDLHITNQLLAEMVEQGCEYAVMEVSSHAIDQGRVNGLEFDGGIFTNLTVDHLDYHNSFKEYVYTKKKFFDLLKPTAFALVNIDDKNGAVMMQNCKALKRTYALKQMADFKGLVLQNSLHGLQMKINGVETFFKLIGKFNAYNLLAVFGAAVNLGLDEEDVRVNLSALGPARGRFEIVYQEEKGIMAIIDYAHTADALENVLKTINELKSKGTKVITVAGAGGDRDTSKRPVMGAVAARLSDTVILTSDNPRSEEPSDIIEDMMEGINKGDEEKVLKITDRAEAIRVATKIASKGDVILIAGKGHETYQEIKGVKRPFDDRQVLTNILF